MGDVGLAGPTQSRACPPGPHTQPVSGIRATAAPLHATGVQRGRRRNRLAGRPGDLIEPGTVVSRVELGILDVLPTQRVTAGGDRELAIVPINRAHDEILL